MHVLLIKTSSMGDILHTLPALTDAVKARKNIRFDWVIEENFVQIPSWHPAVDRVIPVGIRRWRKNWFSKAVREERGLFKQELQKRQYDVVIDAQGLIKSAALITRLAHGVRHGLDRKSAREAFASWFYHHRHQVNREQHAVERIRELFAKSLNYEKQNFYGDYAIGSCFVSKNIKNVKPYLVFIHSTTQDEKHWPEHHWRELITQIAEVFPDLKVKLPWGTGQEYERSCRLAQGFSQVEVLPRCDLQKIASILFLAKAVVSVDTGLSHLAASLDKPNLTLFGPTDPLLVGGYGKNQIAIVSDNKKMETVSVDKIMETLQTVLVKLF